jgi:hypothetical protein
MEFFKVKNWDRFQHYKKRNPPWIKLYTSLLDDYEFGCLQDASKLLALCLLMLAAKTANRLPNDPAWIQKRTGLEQVPDLQPLFDHGFIVLATCKQDASELLAGCKQDSSLSRDRGEERRDIQTEGQKAIPRKSIKEEGMRAISRLVAVADGKA